MSTRVEIPAWANGPGTPGEGSGNGGWSAELFAAQLPDGEPADGAVVSLRVPPPIGRALRIEHAGTSAHVWDDAGDEPVLVATAADHWVDFDVPESVREIGAERAQLASEGFPYRDAHPFPECICCGIARGDDEPSLEIHCGPVDDVTAPDADGRNVPVYADTWVPTADFADPEDASIAVRAACWSALDCPSAAPFADDDERGAIVLARIAVRLEQQARIGETYVLAAWQRSIDGRKLSSVSALIDSSGEVLGRAEALWIEVRT